MFKKIIAKIKSWFGKKEKKFTSDDFFRILKQSSITNLDLTKHNYLIFRAEKYIDLVEYEQYANYLFLMVREIREDIKKAGGSLNIILVREGDEGICLDCFEKLTQEQKNELDSAINIINKFLITKARKSNSPFFEEWMSQPVGFKENCEDLEKKFIGDEKNNE